MELTVIIPAAGHSGRYIQATKTQGTFVEGRSKLDEDLGGRPILQRTVELFANHTQVAHIIVAGPHDDDAFGAFKTKYGDKLGLLGVKLVKGGVTHRYETVAAALAHVPSSTTHIAVHDAARPCCPPELIDRVLEASAHHDAVIPAINVADTLKRVGQVRFALPADPLAAILSTEPPAATLRSVEATVDRSGLIAVQTPQVFSRSLLTLAYSQSDLTSTDDSQLVERMGKPVVVVEGDARNMKITLPADVTLARAILGVQAPQERAAHKRF